MNQNFYNNQMQQQTIIEEENKPVLSNNQNNNNDKKGAWLYLLVIPLLVATIFVGYYLSNKAGDAFQQKRDEIINNKYDKAKEKAKKENYKYLYFELHTIADKFYKVEYRKDVTKDIVLLIQYESVYDLYINNTTDKKAYHIFPEIRTVDETTNKEAVDGLVVVEKTSDYLILELEGSKYYAFKIMSTEKTGTENVNYYHGFTISERLANDYGSAIEKDSFPTKEKAKEILNAFDKDFKIYTCSDKDRIKSCLDKEEKQIDLDHSMSYTEYQKKNYK